MIYSVFYDPLAEFANLDFSGLAVIGKILMGVGSLFLGISLRDREYRRLGLTALLLGLTLACSRWILNYLIS